MAKVLSFEEGINEFPRGPMYWVNTHDGKEGSGNGTGFEMEALAVGAEGPKERREKVCKISTQYPESATEMNGHADLVKKEQLTAPTETDLPSTIHAQPQPDPPVPAQTSNEEANTESPVIQEGTLIPASRPEPVTFVTASETLSTLNEKTGNLTLNGEARGPHKTATANLLDPNITLPENGNGTVEATENAHELGAKEEDVGGGVEEPINEHSNGMLEKVQEKVGITA
jgi:hypothetical protein